VLSKVDAIFFTSFFCIAKKCVTPLYHSVICVLYRMLKKGSRGSTCASMKLKGIDGKTLQEVESAA